MKTLYCLKIFGCDLPLVWHHVPEEQNSQLHGCENLKTQSFFVTLVFVILEEMSYKLLMSNLTWDYNEIHRYSMLKP